MANNINWGKVYCNMATNKSWGADTLWSTNAVPDISAPTCWDVFALTADTTKFYAANKIITADRTQI